MHFEITNMRQEVREPEVQVGLVSCAAGGVAVTFNGCRVLTIHKNGEVSRGPIPVALRVEFPNITPTGRLRDQC